MRTTLAITGLGLALAATAGGCDFLDMGDDGSTSWSDDDWEDDGEDPVSGDGDGFFPGPAPERIFPTVRAAKRPPALSGGTLALHPAGTLAVIADPDRDQVSILDLETNALAHVALAPGSEPGRASFDAAGRAHVALRGANAVASIDLKSKSLLRQSAVCMAPRGIAHHPGQDAMLVACASGELVALDPESHAERSRDFIDRDLRDVVVDREGDVLISRFRNAELLRVREGAIVARLRPRTLTRERLSTELFDEQGEVVELSPTIIKSPTQAWRMVSAGDGGVVVVHERGDDTEVVPAPGGYGGGGCDPIVESTLTRFDADGVEHAGPALGAIAAGVDVAVSPDGKLVAVANPSAYIQGFAGTVRVFRSATVDAGMEDDGCGTFGDGEVGSLGQATAVAFDAQGRLLVQHREPAQLEIYDVGDGEFEELELALRWVIPLANSSVRDTGHDLFHADVGPGVSCASCHGEALDDGHTWTFKGFGPRRTQSLAGGILATAPFHWEGDMRSLRHLVDEVMIGRMGGFEVIDEQVEVLGAWLDGQPALRLEAVDSAAMLRGKALFESAQTACATCHSGAALTNNASVDVGTGGVFQVPSLRGLGLRAPFMHDGCAATLRDRFEPSCGGQLHGNIAELSEQDIDDLVAYLETL